MAFPRLLLRTSDEAIHSFPANDIRWGVRRRPGYSEFDDPAAHDGIIQHAYLVGYDSTALCGFRPLGWRDRRTVPLAAATVTRNPMCTNCRTAVRSPEPRIMHGDHVMDWHPRTRTVQDRRPLGLDAPSADAMVWPEIDLIGRGQLRHLLTVPVASMTFAPDEEAVGVTPDVDDSSSSREPVAAGARSTRATTGRAAGPVRGVRVGRRPRSVRAN